MSDINNDDPIRAMVPTNLFSQYVEGRIGYFGNIWIKQNFIPHAGMFNDGHKHNFDHVYFVPIK